MASERISIAYTNAATVKLEIKRQADGFRYDWADATFKASGWTTRQKTLTEDATTPGLFEDAGPDPAAWSEGRYLFIATETAIVPPIRLFELEVIAGQFAAAAGVARGVWYQDISAVDTKTLASNRAATWLGRLLRYHALLTNAKRTQRIDGTGTVQVFDDVTAILSITAANDGTTQTYEDPV